MSKDKTITIRLNEHDIKHIDELAKMDSRSRNSLIRAVLVGYINNNTSKLIGK